MDGPLSCRVGGWRLPARLAASLFLVPLLPMVAGGIGLRAQPIAVPVTNLADAGPGSFRAAIETANREAINASPGRRIEITFAAGLSGGTVPVVGELPMLFASYATIQVAGPPPAPVVLALPASFVASGDDLLFRDVAFQRPPANAGSGDNVILVGCRRARFERCVFEHPPIAGLFLVGSPDVALLACTFRNSLASRYGQGFLAQDASDRLLAQDCLFEGLRGHGIVLATVSGTRVRNCTFRGVAGGMLITENCLDTEVGPGNLLENSAAHGITADLAGPMDPRNPAGIGLRIFDNTIRDGVTSGILLHNRCTRVVIEGNLLERNARDGNAQVVLQDADTALVRNNRILAGSGSGLAIVRGQIIDVHGGNLIDGNIGPGVIVDAARDVWLGPRDPAGAIAGNVIRNNRGVAARITRASGVFVTGNTVLAGGRTAVTGNSGPIAVEQSAGCQLGPGLDVTGGNPAMQVTNSSSAMRVLDVVAAGYQDCALRVSACTDIIVRDCRFQGGNAATGLQVFDSSPVQLFGNHAANHTFAGFSFNGCAQVLVGPGNRAVRNTLFGFTFNRGGAAAPFAVVQSAVAINHSGAGSGLAFQDVSGTVVNTTSAGNDRGIQVDMGANVTVVDSIFWSNRDRDRVAGPSATATMRYCTWATSQGTWLGGQGASTTNPRLSNLAADDVRLLSGSPAIDTGDPYGLDLPPVDAAGEQRVLGATVDRGAHEYAGASTALVLVGAAQRDRGDNSFVFDLDAGSARGGRQRLLLAGFSGTAPGHPLAAGARLPLQVDVLTSAWAASPLALGVLDGSGRERLTFTLPAPVMAALPAELTFAFTVLSAFDWASNPVVMRFW